MPIAFQCPSCLKKLTVKDEMAGKTAKCPCGAQITIPQPGGQPQPNSPAADPGTAVGSMAPMGHPGQPMPGSQMPGSQMPGNQMTPPAPAPAAPQMSSDSLQNLNPEFKVQCLQCGQQYPMRPDLYGQTVACQCGAPIRFDDPLGSGGLMSNFDALGQKPAEESNQPLAYQSVATQTQSKKAARAREEEVLKRYIKEDDDGKGGNASLAPAKPRRRKGSRGGGMSDAAKSKAWGSLGIGILGVIGGACWAILPVIYADRFYPYSIVVIVVGIAGIGNGLWSFSTGNEIPDKEE